jgi:hypothetical protein
VNARAMAPRDSARKPIRAINHRCGPGPVKAIEGELCEALDGAEAAGVGVAPPLAAADDPGDEVEPGDEVGAEDAGDDAPPADPPDPLVVALGVVVPPVDELANEIDPTARSPLMSPMARTQVSPAAC